MEYEEYAKNRKQFLALTSLEIEEFHYLLRHFAPLWKKYYRYHTTEGAPFHNSFIIK